MSQFTMEAGAAFTVAILPREGDEGLGIRAATVAEYLVKEGSEYGLVAGKDTFGPDTIDAGTVQTTPKGLVIRVLSADQKVVERIQTLVDKGEDWEDEFTATVDPHEQVKEKAQERISRLFNPQPDEGETRVTLKAAGLRGKRFAKLPEPEQDQLIAEFVQAARDDARKRLEASPEAANT